MIAATDMFTTEPGTDLRETIGNLWKGRNWIAATSALCAAGFAAASLLMTPLFMSSTVLIASSPERQSLTSSIVGAVGSLGGLASLAGLNVAANSADTEEALAVLRSRQFTEAFIRDRNLMPELYASQWDPATGSWKTGSKPPTLGKAFKYFDGSVRSIQQDKKTGLVTMEIVWKDPARAADWANDLVARLNAEMRSRAIAKADASLGFLEKELQTTSVVATREAINRLIEAQVKQRMLASVTQEFAFRVVDRALPADRDDKVSPHRALLTLTGLVLGAVASVIVLLTIDWWRSAPRSAP